MKKCAKCGETKSLDQFYRNARTKDGRYAYCIPCRKAYYRENEQRDRERNAQYREDNPDQTRAAAARWREQNPDHWRKRRFKHRYDITVEEYDRLHALQRGLCAICEQECTSGRRLSVEHDHVTGKIRGLCCGSCNRALGLLQDSPHIIRRAAAYLEENTFDVIS